MSIDLRQMRHVLALAEHGSFARAAVALRLSQPALSRSIQGLEQQVGTELFLRTTAGVVPTDIGRLLIQRARQVVQLAEDLAQEVLSNRSLQSGHVTVGGGPFPVESTLSNALARFVSAYPQVNVRLQVRDWDELLRRLRARELDFFIAEISTLQQEHDLDIEPMSVHPLFFVARTDHPLAARSRVTPVDTFSFPFISPARIPPRILEPMLAAQRKARDPAAAARAFPSLECNSLSAVKRIIAGSDAVTAVTLSCIVAELENGQFTLLTSEPWLSLRYGLVKLKGYPMSSASTKFREFVIDAEHAASREEERLVAKWNLDARSAR
jgi:DNA-binding transcriptional LysR family regulator